jgi:hypothetical protein
VRVTQGSTNARLYAAAADKSQPATLLAVKELMRGNFSLSVSDCTAVAAHPLLFAAAQVRCARGACCTYSVVPAVHTVWCLLYIQRVACCTYSVGACCTYSVVLAVHTVWCLLYIQCGLVGAGRTDRVRDELTPPFHHARPNPPTRLCPAPRAACVRRERGGVVSRSRVILCRPVPYPTHQIRHEQIHVRFSLSSCSTYCPLPTLWPGAALRCVARPPPPLRPTADHPPTHPP